MFNDSPMEEPGIPIPRLLTIKPSTFTCKRFPHTPRDYDSKYIPYSFCSLLNNIYPFDFQ